ncbi:MAG TPA: DinB family protein [Puia sp.]|jgi:uncharacterized damage-inducible protein DinB|nr:DinB family protein [Puia sp.]
MLSSSHLSRLNAQPEDLIQILSNIQPDMLEKEIQPGKWSIKANVAHLVRYQQESIQRVHSILKLWEPNIKRYVAEDDEEFPAVLSLPTNALVMHLKKDRIQFHNLLNSLTDEQLSRTGRHPVLGSLTLTEWIEFFLLHESHHMMTIFKLAHA